MASSLKLEYPLNDVLPNIEDRRDRLLARIFEFRRSGANDLEIEEADYEMLYAYGEYHFNCAIPGRADADSSPSTVLVTGQLADDLSAVIKDLETLFGTLNEDNLKLQ